MDDTDVDHNTEAETPPANFLLGEETYAILGACFAVYKEIGCGFLEAVYQECMEIELQSRGIPFVAQPVLQLNYRGKSLRQTYMADFVCYGSIIVELKAVQKLIPEHPAQVMNYLRAARNQLALLINFGHFPKVEHERIVATTGRYAKSEG